MFRTRRAWFIHDHGDRFMNSGAALRSVCSLGYLLEKALYELRYELNNRPDWARIPRHGILQLLDETPA
jgi:predicted trehalose synthase